MEIDHSLCNGFVLAGGKSSRMGSDKGFLPFKGKAMVYYALEALQPICSTVQIISNNPAYKEFDYPVIQDVITNRGPLAGICTGLSNSKFDVNAFITCDSPNIQAQLFEYLLEHLEGYDAVVPFYNQKLFPLTAIYTKNCLEPFMYHLRHNQLRVKEVIESVRVHKIALNSHLPFFNSNMLININTRKELESHEN